ncbi:DegT/DnrJ/EryC1/StrS family aminotransferase [Streptomyces sp. NPDC059063]|uniref:DegT/DnrJ/EryC1/StrS family aminotransferase n=1 Tax=unclassified Streptomyces TaxID=2593676 RepID=UPI00368850F3
MLNQPALKDTLVTQQPTRAPAAPASASADDGPRVPFFSGAASIRRDWPRLEPRLRAIAATGRFTSGEEVARLEDELCAYTGAGHVALVGSGTDALTLMLRATGIGPGDEVIVPAYSFFATASSVLHAGAEPVMVDVLPDSYALDPERAARAITPATKAIMPVHLFHQTADMAPLCELAEDRGLLLVEDSAEAIGMRVDGRHAGLFGTAGVLSFFPTKTLGALGDAGAVLTDDGELDARVRRLRVHGQSADGSYEHLELGWNSRADEVQAAVLRTRLEHLDEDIARRAELAARYDKELSGLAPFLRTPRQAPARRPSNLVWYVYLIETDRRDALVAHLARHGVETEVYYPRPLPEQPCLAGRRGARHPVPVATAASRRAVALPLYPDLTEEQVAYVCSVIRAFPKDGGGR